MVGNNSQIRKLYFALMLPLLSLTSLMAPTCLLASEADTCRCYCGVDEGGGGGLDRKQVGGTAGARG